MNSDASVTYGYAEIPKKGIKLLGFKSQKISHSYSDIARFLQF